MNLARDTALLVLDLFGFAARSGRWWLPMLTIIFGIAALLVVAAKVAVPTVVYVLF